MLVSTVHQNESALHISISPPFWTSFSLGHCSALRRALCAIQCVLIACMLSYSTCPTLRNLMDHSLPDSTVLGIFQARILEWICHFLLQGSSQPKDRTSISCLLHWQAGSLPLSHLGRPRAFLCVHNCKWGGEWKTERNGKVGHLSQDSSSRKGRAPGYLLYPSPF